MSTAYVVVTVIAAALVAFSAAANIFRFRFIVRNLENYGVPRSWWPWLSLAKAAGAAGLLVGLAVPVVGMIAAIGLVLFFLGAVVTVIRARWFVHIPLPLVFLAPVVGSLTLGVATLV